MAPSRNGAKRSSPRFAVVLLAAAIVLSLGIWWWKSKSADNPSASNSAVANAANSSSEFQKLKGRWQRLDGGYIVEIKGVAGNGSIEAAYFNPQSIHVAKAEASKENNA